MYTWCILQAHTMRAVVLASLRHIQFGWGLRFTRTTGFRPKSVGRILMYEKERVLKRGIMNKREKNALWPEQQFVLPSRSRRPLLRPTVRWFHSYHCSNWDSLISWHFYVQCIIFLKSSTNYNQWANMWEAGHTTHTDIYTIQRIGKDTFWARVPHTKIRQNVRNSMCSETFKFEL